MMNEYLCDHRHGSITGLSSRLLQYDLYFTLKEESNDKFECRELGRREVFHTLQEMKKLNQAVSDYANWAAEVSG